MMKFDKRNLVEITSHVLALVLVLLVTAVVSVLLYVWFDFPRGNDAVSHLYRTKFVADFFPNINWVWPWAGGMPMFATYPSLPNIVMALFQKLTNLSVATILNGAAVFWGIGISGFGIYLIVCKIGKSWFAGMLAGVIYITTPSVWHLAFSGGLYSRELAIPFLVLAIWAFFSALLGKNSDFKKKYYVLASIFLGLCILFHYTVGAVAIVSIFAIYVFADVSFSEKLSGSLKIFLPAILVASSLIVPLVVFGFSFGNLKESNFLARQYLLLTPVSRVFNLLDTNKPDQFLVPSHWIRLTPFVLPFLLLLLVFLLFGKERLERKYSRVILALVLLSFGWLVYSVVVLPIFQPAYYTVGGPVIGMTYLPIFAALAIGMIWSSSFRKGVFGQMLSVLIILAALGWFVLQYGVIERRADTPYFREKTFDDTLFQFAREIVPSRNQFNFRLGDGDDNGTLASWLNIEYPITPQTRDYYFQGVVNKDYYAQKDVEIWHKSNNYEETNFLLDWWGVQQFLIAHAGDVREKFENRTEYISLGGSLNDEAYLFSGASPVISATDTQTVLVVGQNASAYDSVFRGLARGNINSQVLIPIHGVSFIDDYTDQDLGRFEAIFLYNWRFHDQKKEQQLLTTYVSNGGRLVIESNIDEESQNKLFDPFPVETVKRSEISGDWKFNSVGSLYGEVDFGKFSPPVFDRGPWGISIADNVKSWAKATLLVGDKPIVVVGNYGKGTVVWSGLNLPFHVNLYDSQSEAEFFAKLLTGKTLAMPVYKVDESLKGASVFETDKYHLIKEAIAKLNPTKNRLFEGDGYTVSFVNPQKQFLSLKRPFSGVLLKEFYTANMRAYQITDGRTKTLSVYKAGPDFIYVPLDNSKAGDEVLLEYRPSLWERASTIVSVVTLLVLALYFFDWWILKGLVKNIEKMLFIPFSVLKNWWAKED